MLNKNQQILSFCISIGIGLGMVNRVNAHSEPIKSLTDFYDYYGDDFNPEEKEIIKGIFGNIEKYLEPNGLEQAIADGFIPFTRPWEYHGTHWFNPKFVDLTNVEADPFLPAGLNIDVNGELAGVFWAEELYEPPLVPLLQSLDLANTDPATLTQLYGQYQQNVKQTPTAFSVFGNEAEWHTHKNVVIENLGAKNAQGKLDPEIMNFRQSLSDENFINELLISLNSDEIVLSPLESDPSLGYPDFNRGITPGFYMIHMWVGLGNHDGLFAGTNLAIPVSENAINESETFEDGSGGHDHGGGDNAHNPDTHSIPEPSTVIGILGLAFLPLKKFLIQN